MSLNETQIAAGTKDVLRENGFVSGELPEEWHERERSAFVFEDEYSIVGVVLYATCEELINEWAKDQGALNSKISEYIGRGEAKSSDGYLVLLTSGLPEEKHREDLTRIRYNTSRLRKLVATGEDLAELGDIENALQPVLPLQISSANEVRSSGLYKLPSLLGLPEEATEGLVEAYWDQTSLLEALHQYTQNQ